MNSSFSFSKSADKRESRKTIDDSNPLLSALRHDRKRRLVRLHGIGCTALS